MPLKEEKMKAVKYFIMGVLLFLAGCEGAESEIENNKPEVVWEDDAGAII
jgi:starvation-inducible outer membrane lipoprotein